MTPTNLHIMDNMSINIDSDFVGQFFWMGWRVSIKVNKLDKHKGLPVKHLLDIDR